jgi:hypothetical protein
MIPGVTTLGTPIFTWGKAPAGKLSYAAHGMSQEMGYAGGI